MSDDIVTRLQNAIVSWRESEWVDLDDWQDAADEIERLRADRDRLWERLLMWRETADALHYDYCCADGQAVLGGEEKYRNSRNEWDQWEKAVRGNA